MNPKTSQALEASISHWYENMEMAHSGGDIEDNIYSNSCPLCREFIVPDENTGYADCEGCPIRTKTGKPYCEDTPWEDIYLHFEGLNSIIKLEGDYDLINLIKNEIQFLESLREE